MVYQIIGPLGPAILAGPKDLLGLLLPNYFADDNKKKGKKIMTFMSFDS